MERKNKGSIKKGEQNQTLRSSFLNFKKGKHIFFYMSLEDTLVHIIQHSLMSGEMNCWREKNKN